MFRTKQLCSLLANANKFIIEKQAVRTLYATEALGIDGYLIARERTKAQIPNPEKFRSKMLEFVEDSSSKNLIFTEDLKNMVHLSEKDDLNLLEQMIKKFSSQSKEVRFGNFVFGPPVMRLLYFLKEDDHALKLFKDDSLNGFFDQLISYQLLLDLLYEQNRYQDVLDMFNIIKSRQVQGGRFPKHVLVITFAACYKMNTPQALEYAVSLWKELNIAGHIPMRKSVTFLAGLALNQNAPHIALEVISSVKQQNYMTVRNIKAQALVDLGRYEDVLPILRSVLEVDNPLDQKHTFAEDVIEKIQLKFESNTNKDVQMDFDKILKFLRDQGHVNKESMDDLLCKEIQSTAQSSASNSRYNDRRSGGYNEDRRGGNYSDDRRGGNYNDDRRGNYNDERRGNYNEDRRGGYNEDRRGGYNEDRRGGNNKNFQRRDQPNTRTNRPGLHELN